MRVSGLVCAALALSGLACASAANLRRDGAGAELSRSVPDKKAPVQEIMDLLDMIEETITGEKKDAIEHIKPEVEQCREDKARLEAREKELQKEAVSKEDCTKTGEAELRAMIEDGMKRIQHLEGVKAKREQDVQETIDLRKQSKAKLEKRNDRHEKALNAVRRIAEVVGDLQGGDATALLEVAGRDADVSDSFHREDAEAIADLLSRLKGHMGDAMQEYKKQHVHEKSSWESVLNTQHRALRAVEGDLEQARSRVEHNKRRLAAARSGVQQCIVNARNAAHELEGLREQLQGKRAACKTVEDAFAREHNHRKHELVIIDKIRAIVVEKLDALGTYLRERVQSVMQEETGATGAGAKEEEEEELEGEAEEVASATGAAAEALEAAKASQVDDVPEGAKERMPADRYTGTGTGAQGVQDAMAHGEGAASGGVDKAPEAAARDQAAHDMLAQDSEDELESALSAGMDAVTPATGATGATGAAGNDQCHYAYAGVHGPDYWKDLCGGKWSSCDSRGSGLQSPIDIKQEAVTAVTGAALPANYHSVSGVRLYNTGSSLVIKGGDFGALNVGGTTYHATRIEFHAASEHTFDQRHSHVEMQIVHETRVGPNPRFAVVSVMLDRAPVDEEASGELWKLGFNQDDTLPTFEGASMPLNPVRLGDFKDAALIGAYYRYEGSLTVPPCTEGAQWFVAKTPLRVPAAWVQAVESVILRNTEPAMGNNRPTQPLRSRDVKLVEPSVFA